MPNSLLKKFFGITYFDQTIKIRILGILRLNKRLWIPNFPYKEATTYGLVKKSRDIRIIASLTSLPRRINFVHKAINTLLTQTLKPDKLILWLSDKQFKNKEGDLPDNLLRLRNFGLEIRWCRDLGSYKKLIPALKEFPDDIIITFDDDMYYPENTVEDLYNSYLKNKKAVHAMRARKLIVLGDSIVSKDFGTEFRENKKDLSFNNMVTGCAGCLYPPHCLYKDVLDENLISSLIPTRDDTFFWAMATLAGTKTQIVNGYSQSFYYIRGTQRQNLAKINRENGEGISAREAFRRISQRYPQILDVLKTDKYS